MSDIAYSSSRDERSSKIMGFPTKIFFQKFLVFPVLMILTADQTKKYVKSLSTSKRRKASKLGMNDLEGLKKFTFSGFFDIIIVALSSAIQKSASCAFKLNTFIEAIVSF